MKITIAWENMVMRVHTSPKRWKGEKH